MDIVLVFLCEIIAFALHILLISIDEFFFLYLGNGNNSANEEFTPSLLGNGDGELIEEDDDTIDLFSLEGEYVDAPSPPREAEKGQGDATRDKLTCSACVWKTFR